MRSRVFGQERMDWVCTPLPSPSLCFVFLSSPITSTTDATGSSTPNMSASDLLWWLWLVMSVIDFFWLHFLGFLWEVVAEYIKARR